MITGDVEVISKAIDEVVEPNVLYHAPKPDWRDGAQVLKQVWPVLLRAFPDLHVAVEEVIAEGGQGRLQGHHYRDPPGRVQGPPTNRQIRHLQRDLLSANPPPGYTDPMQFQSGNPYGTSHVTCGGAPSEVTLEAVRYQARRVVDIAAALKAGRAA
jgi:hypothetical protein